MLLSSCSSVDEASEVGSTDSPLVVGAAEAVISVNSWGPAYCADVKVTNKGTAPMSAVSLTFDWAGTAVTNLWNGTRSGNVVTPALQGSQIAPGANATFGFCGNGTGKPQIASVDYSGGGGSGISCVHGTVSNGLCTCAVGWVGAACDTPSVSRVHGTVSNGLCTCAVGWVGAACDTPSVSCVNGTVSNGQCTCAVGWVGASCDTPAGGGGGATLKVSNSWNGGYCADVTIIGGGNWTVGLDTHNSIIYNSWNGTFSGKSGKITVKGAQSSFGFCANTTGSLNNQASIVSVTR